jgi:anthranilate phosphoribosyltransferase
MGALLAALRAKGETVDEIVGAATAMRARATALPEELEGSPQGGAMLVDCCGTGGDGRATLNVSTIAALVVAACGVKVAKHGNRAVSSRSGSADVLSSLGVNISCGPGGALRCLREAGICFLFAPDYHGATRHAAGVRRELGVRTIFNLLGPLTNPAGVRRQLLGVFDPKWCEPIAQALSALGSERALVVHGEGGLDEIAPAGKTFVAELAPDGAVRTFTLSPADFGLAEEDPAGLRGGEPAENAARAREILAGQPGAARAAVVMAAAATLRVAERAQDFPAGARMAEAAIDSGRARQILETLVRVSGGGG